MSYKKFKADHIFTGTKMLDNDFVLITNEDGIVKDIIEKNDAGEDIQYFKGILDSGLYQLPLPFGTKPYERFDPGKNGFG